MERDQERGRRRPIDRYESDRRESHSNSEPRNKHFRESSESSRGRDSSQGSTSRGSGGPHPPLPSHQRFGRQGSRERDSSRPSTSRDLQPPLPPQQRFGPQGSRERDSSHASTSHGAVGVAPSNPQPRPPPPPPAHQREGGRQRGDRFEIVRTRPSDVLTKVGTDGQPIQLQSNYFSLRTKPQWEIQHYCVDFVPDIEMVRVRCGVLSEHARILGTGYLFDGKQLFTTKKFEENTVVLNTTSKQGVDYTITIKWVGLISTAESRFLQVLNLILRRSMKGLKLEQVGRNLFDPHAKVALREFALELWPGYETSIRQHENEILLCTEITHKVMRTETVYDILRRTSHNPSRFQEEFRVNVLGLIVLTDYNNKTYRVNEVDFSQSPRSTFHCKGQDVSFVDYYLQKYNIRIRDHNQPLLVSKNRDKAQKANADEIVVLIPELCRVTGLTDNMRSNFQLMRAMADHTRMVPSRRIDRLRTLNQRLQTTAESVKVLSDWNMTLDQKLVEVRGRIIDDQRIVFNNKVRVLAGKAADWTSQLRDKQMLTTPTNGLDRWAVIAPNRNMRDLETLLNNLNRTSRGLGFQIGQPRTFKIDDDRTSSYVQTLMECARMDPKLILCLVPNNNVERYSSIKKKGCVELAIPTQVVTTRANQKGLSVATKIAIQLNCKLGYTPWMIELPLSGLMTIGFDIAKCSRDRSKAYCALVASMDLQQNSTYFSTVAECNVHDILANNLWPMMMKALRQYHREHQKLPTRILIYRDGVSSGSLRQLFEYEVKDLVEKLTIEYEKMAGTKPLMAYIVVTKACNTRFFTMNQQNPPPGTVVDNVVTLPERYDFYLVSQTVRQGTVAPTSYNVVYSNIRLSPDQIQKLTYKMCHLYYNWSGTTRVPAVCQYAKKLATLVGTNMHSIPANALEKKLYYL
ncbi:piwi [Drosophila busckii]|uniref:Piwi n=1 Tax=Drosophila busckii TaxID=30019 RepID=A0A0M3QTP9_DROBS|nr:protein piwi [Drosophila busckii]ALC39293.1 piwi [Drosophila busckii]